MNNKRTSVGVLCATLLALCVVSLAAYISMKQHEREAELTQLRKEINEAIKELRHTKERNELLVQELLQKAGIAEAARQRALSRIEFLTAPHRHD